MSRNSPETILKRASLATPPRPTRDLDPRRREDAHAFNGAVGLAAPPETSDPRDRLAKAGTPAAAGTPTDERRRCVDGKRWPGRTAPTSGPEPKIETQPRRSAGSPVDPLAEIALRLRTAAGNLVSATGQAGGERLASLIARALAGLIDQFVRDLRIRVGTIAQSAAPASRRRLQDLALAARPDPDRLLTDVARSLTDSELLAILGVSCWSRDAGSLDALRCRDLVLGGGNAMAREAALDMTGDGLCESARIRIETVVARHMRTVVGLGLEDATMLALLDAAFALRASDIPTIEPADRITERRLGRSLLAGDRSAAIALLAESSGLEPEQVGAAFERRDQKALVSLLWKAGFDPALAIQVQIVLGRVAPDEIANGPGEDGFPFRRAEMQWASEGLRTP